MLTIKQNLMVVAATALGSLLFMAGLNRVWPWEKRSAHNDLIGWQLSIFGTTYAVILGFMLYAVWGSFGEAELNVDLHRPFHGLIHVSDDAFRRAQQSMRIQ